MEVEGEDSNEESANGDPGEAYEGDNTEVKKHFSIAPGVCYSAVTLMSSEGTELLLVCVRCV